LLLLHLLAVIFLVNTQVNALKSTSIFENMVLWETQSDLVPATNCRFNKRIPTLKVKNLPLAVNDLTAKTYRWMEARLHIYKNENRQSNV